MNPAIAKFEQRAHAVDSLLCVGLDLEVNRIPTRFASAEFPQFEFGKWLLEQTGEVAAAIKPNVAFYEARGSKGLHELELTMEYVRAEWPDLLTICDAKRGDIGNTNEAYAEAIFDTMGFDAVTLHPYLGREALSPFLSRTDKASIILCRTSNPGAGEFQDLETEDKPLWLSIAEQVSTRWNTAGNCMLVVGATYPDEMKAIRKAAPELTFLVPGVGAQGGDVAAVVTAGLDAHGKGLIVSSSRAIIFSDDPEKAARKTRDEINGARTAHAHGEAHAAR